MKKLSLLFVFYTFTSIANPEFVILSNPGGQNFTVTLAYEDGLDPVIILDRTVGMAPR